MSAAQVLETVQPAYIAICRALQAIDGIPVDFAEFTIELRAPATPTVMILKLAAEIVSNLVLEQERERVDHVSISPSLDDAQMLMFTVHFRKEAPQAPVEKEPPLPEMPISELALATRTRNLLVGSGLTTIQEVLHAGAERIRAIKGMGEFSLYNLDERLTEFGYNLKDKGDDG